MPRRLCRECRMPELTNVREVGYLCTVAHVRAGWNGRYAARKLAEHDKYSELMA